MDAKKQSHPPLLPSQYATVRTDISLDDYFELLDLLGAIFETLSESPGPWEMMARMRTAATVFREKHEMMGTRLEDVYRERLGYNLRARYRRASRATTPLLPHQAVRDWDDTSSSGGKS